MYNTSMRFLILLLSLSLLASCGKRSEVKPIDQVVLLETAQTLMQQAAYEDAAVAYLQLAAANPQTANRYRLLAAKAYLKASAYAAAEQILTEPTIAADPPLELEFQLLRAELALKLQRPSQALAVLAALPAAMPANMKRLYHDKKARAHLANNNLIDALKEQLNYQQYLVSEQALLDNSDTIWTLLNRLPPADLTTEQSPPALASWVELMDLYQRYRFNNDRLGRIIDSWQEKHPDHPARMKIIPELIAASTMLTRYPKQIALLLPFSGQYQGVAEAILNGFLAAHYLKQGNNKPTLAIYDTAQVKTITDSYQQAVADGAEYIIGPLAKSAVNQLSSVDITVPTLVLNTIDTEHGIDNENLIQFSLSPEAEAAAVADIIIANGHRSGLIIAPDINWGRRMTSAFKVRLEALGGTLLSQGYFDTDSTDFKKIIKTLFNINKSEQRQKLLRRTVNRKLHYVPRRRQDVDFIFLATIAKHGRQILPQLKFQEIDDLPIYGSSYIFSGTVDKEKDLDLEGVIFVDMPWVVDIKRKLSQLQDTLNQHWPVAQSTQRRFYALGIDSYHLIAELARLRSDDSNFLSGETGQLSVSEDNIIKRQLTPVQFVSGEPVLLNRSP